MNNLALERNFILNRVVDVGRSIPFILLVVFLFPFTRMLIGTAIGTKAMIVPLTICAIPFEIRLIEEILFEVPYSIIEAAKIDGVSNLKIIIRIKWACKVPYLVNAIGITLINIIGYSAMAGVVVVGGIAGQSTGSISHCFAIDSSLRARTNGNGKNCDTNTNVGGVVARSCRER